MPRCSKPQRNTQNASKRNACLDLCPQNTASTMFAFSKIPAGLCQSTIRPAGSLTVSNTNGLLNKVGISQLVGEFRACGGKVGVVQSVNACKLRHVWLRAQSEAWITAVYGAVYCNTGRYFAAVHGTLYNCPQEGERQAATQESNGTQHDATQIRGVLVAWARSTFLHQGMLRWTVLSLRWFKQFVRTSL